jgi:hypothetical protein
MSYINIKFQTDQSGANNNVCSGTSQVFNFSLTDTHNVSYADISLKKGSGTTSDIVCSIYDAPNGGGSLVSSVTVLAANVTQTFESTLFTFTNTTLSPGIPYSLVISSSTSCVGSNPYSMKSGNFQVLNSDTGGLLNTGYGISANITTLCSLSANSSIIKGQRIFINGNKTVKFRLGSKTPKMYKGNSVLYNPNNN